MPQTIHIVNNLGREETIDDIKKPKFHPILSDIENIFWFVFLSNKALMLVETQDILMNDECFGDLLKKYNDWTKLSFDTDKDKGTYLAKSNVQDQMIFFGKALSVLMYDYLSASKYNARINNIQEFQFLRFIRNGAAHYNTFNIKDENGDWKIKKNQDIVWQSKKINRILHGSKVFPMFVSIFDIYLLANDISEILFNIDKDIKN